MPVQPVSTGDARFRVTMTADQLTSGKVIAEESTMIYEDQPAAPASPGLAGREQGSSRPFRQSPRTASLRA